VTSRIENGGLKPLVPFTYSMMVIGSLALMDFLFNGILLKDLILEVAMVNTLQ
jgi:NADH:ubiquinone oxidoreductase subunit 5 (subunit L)/multisubunit Na+/H+ antiporter MnhA subunit